MRVRALDAEDDPAVDDLFDGVASALTGSAGQRALGAAGFRTPDGDAPSSAAETDAVDVGAPMGTSVTDATGLDDARTGWATQGRRSRLLMVMDLSGSMGERLPDGRTRAEAAQDALRGLVEGASPDDALGLWGFTTLIGNGDYEILLPAQQLDATSDGVSLRSQFLTEVDQLAPVPGGSTSLYDTVAAGYATATDRYVDGRFNAVVVVTDGRNEDPGSRTLPGCSTTSAVASTAPGRCGSSPSPTARTPTSRPWSRSPTRRAVAPTGHSRATRSGHVCPSCSPRSRAWRPGSGRRGLRRP